VKQNLKIFFILLVTVSFALPGTQAWSEPVVVTYDPRTGMATLGTGRNRTKAIIEDIEKVLSTAKQISVDKRGRISATIDIDMEKVLGKSTGKSFGSKKNSKAPKIIVTNPVSNSLVSQSALKIEGVVVDKDYRIIDISVSNGKVSAKYRARVKSKGEFSKKVNLSNGQNVIVLRSRSRAGEKYERSLTVGYFPSNIAVAEAVVKIASGVGDLAKRAASVAGQAVEAAGKETPDEAKELLKEAEDLVTQAEASARKARAAADSIQDLPAVKAVNNKVGEIAAEAEAAAGKARAALTQAAEKIAELAGDDAAQTNLPVQYKADSTHKIKELYSRMKTAYEYKDERRITKILSPDWASSDGSTALDVEDHLREKFDVYDDIRCTISNLQIDETGSNTFKVTYEIEIIGQIYDKGITRKEKSSITEEVSNNNGKFEISRSISGNFWYRE